MKETRYEVRYTIDNRVKSIRQVDGVETRHACSDAMAWMLVAVGVVAIVVILL